MGANTTVIRKAGTRAGSVALSILLAGILYLPGAPVSLAFADVPEEETVSDALSLDLSTLPLMGIADNRSSGNTLPASFTAPRETADDIAAEAAANAAKEAGTTIFNVSNIEEMKAASLAVNDYMGDGEYTINLTEDIDLSAGKTHKQHHLQPRAGKTIAIIGNGHTIYYSADTSTQLEIGAFGGTLELGKADGSDHLTITTKNGSTSNPLVTITGDQNGSVAALYIHNGVEIRDSENTTGLAGAVSATHADIYMDGGTIANCHNKVSAPWGGGIYLEGGSLHMSGGVIEDCSQPDMTYFTSLGGGVAIGVHGSSDTFDMSGNAVIQNNNAPWGGGVYVGSASKFSMSDNAAITGNHAGQFGGGLFVEKGGQAEMSGNASITGNSATYGGGVYVYGKAALDRVYNNTAEKSGDDIYNNGEMTLPPVEDNLTLAADNEGIDGWYYDGYRENDDNGDGTEEVDRTRWNPDTYADAYTADAGRPTTEHAGLKAAHDASGDAGDKPAKHADAVWIRWVNQDGTLLYQMDNVSTDDIPGADEYNRLSGNGDPTEPPVEGKQHVFTGWFAVPDQDGNITYIANYKLVDEPQQNQKHTITVHYVRDDGTRAAPDHVETVDDGDRYDIASPAIDGYEPDQTQVSGTADGDREATVVYHKITEPATDSGTGTDDNDADGDDAVVVVSESTGTGDTDNSGDMNQNKTRTVGNSSDESRSSDAPAILEQTGDDMPGIIIGISITALVAGGSLIAIRRKRTDRELDME